MAVDPFALAQQFVQNQQGVAAQERGDTQNMLMNMFQTEAARQAPYSAYPVQRALQNNASENSLHNSMQMAEYNNGIKTRRDAQLKMAPEAIRKSITGMSQQFGEDANYYMQLADVESGFRADAQNKSGAAGLFQFMPTTAKQYGLSNPFDTEASMQAAIKLTRDNRNALRNGLGEEPTQGMLYLAHQQGAGGALKLLKNRDAPAESVVPLQHILQNGGRRGMTAGQFADMWMSKFQRGYDTRIANLRKPKPEDESSFAQYKDMLNTTEGA